VVVIPAYQAARTLPSVLAGLARAAPASHVLVVDDGSSDGTGRVAADRGAQVLALAGNAGKGRALAAGVAEALARGAAAVVTMDADGQHPPELVPALLAPLEAGRADVVVGARRRDDGTMPWPRQVTNWLSSALVSRALGTAVPDSQCGFRAFTRGVAEAIRPAGARYEYETEFLLMAGAAGFRIASVTVPTVYAGSRSHFRHATDTLRLARVFIRHWRPILLGPAGS